MWMTNINIINCFSVQQNIFSELKTSEVATDGLPASCAYVASL